MFQIERFGQLLRVVVQRVGIETIGIEKQRNSLHAAGKLSLLTVEELTTLWARLN